MRPFPGEFRPLRSLRWAVAGVAVILALTVRPGVSATPNEFGHPVFRDFPPGKSAFGHLCQAVTQDPDGFIYLANAEVTRCYDGATWERIAMPTECAGIRKFAVATDGTVFAGGAGVIGYFRAAGGHKAFVSLADRLPSTETGYDEISEVLAVGNTLYFADEEKILIWRDQRFTVIPCRTPPHSRGAHLHRVGETVYVTAPDRALSRLVEDRLEPVADDPVFRQNPILSVEEGKDGALVFLTADRGFFQLAAGHVTPFPTEANRWLAGKHLIRALRLPDRSHVVAFSPVSGDGGMRFGPDGSYLGPIDQSIGLYVKTLRGFFCDREGGLWLGTETGLFRLEWPSALSIFDGVNGLGLGAVADVVRHDGVLYAATSEGVFRLAASDDSGRGARFERVFGVPAYALVSHPGGLLTLGYAEVLAQSADGFASVAKLPAGGGTMFCSKRDPARVWIKTTQGVWSIRHTPAGWRNEGVAKDVTESEREAPDVTAGSRMRWPQLVRESAGKISRMFEETHSGGRVRWICGEKGLLRVDLARGFPAPVPFAALLTATGVRENERLPPRHPALTFEFVALRHQIANGVAYQTRLLGHSADWSPWSSVREQSYTFLPAGDYRFDVRARDADGQLSAVASLAFVVLPPWWLTRWALLVYVALGSGVVAGVVRLRMRALRQRARQLEDIVAERTVELAEKNLELVRLNQLELDEKISARLGEEKARLEVLRYQLNPHFLFNALATISGLAVREPAAARAVARQLAEFCRLTLTRGRHEFVTMDEEFQMLASYLDVVRAGREEVPEIALTLGPGAGVEKIPAFLLLPLVENAAKYGRGLAGGPLRLELSAQFEPGDGALAIEVANTGTWMDDFADHGDTPSTRIGLDNIRERLARTYPGAHAFTTEARDGWVRVRIRLTPVA